MNEGENNDPGQGFTYERVVDLLVGGIGPDLMALSISARKAWTLPGGAMAQVPAMSGYWPRASCSTPPWLLGIWAEH